MTTNITVDDTLLEEAMAFTGASTKDEAVDKGLRLVAKLNQQKKLKDWFGKLNWEGDLEEMRKD